MSRHRELPPKAVRQMGILVRVWREGARLTQGQLAKLMGTSRPVVTRLERGTHTPQLPLLYAVAKATGRDLAELGKLLDSYIQVERSKELDEEQDELDRKPAEVTREQLERLDKRNRMAGKPYATVFYPDEDGGM